LTGMGKFKGKVILLLDIEQILSGEEKVLINEIK
jgi:chemotaxis signal transduction protein